MLNPLVIINNEKIFKDNDSYYCDNLDLKVLPEGLNNYNKVHYIVRTSKKNLFTLLLKLLKFLMLDTC